MKDFLLYVSKRIVNDPDSVEVAESEDTEGLVTLRMKVAPDDMGRIIGKNGKIINAIRALTRIIAIKEGKRVEVDLEDVPRNEDEETAKKAEPEATQE